MSTYARKEAITLFITERRAFEAADAENGARVNAGMDPLTLRVLGATLRDDDGTMDRGFKVLMVPKRGIGELPYYL